MFQTASYKVTGYPLPVPCISSDQNVANLYQYNRTEVQDTQLSEILATTVLS
jgi:hypothetical protein